MGNAQRARIGGSNSPRSAARKGTKLADTAGEDVQYIPPPFCLCPRFVSPFLVLLSCCARSVLLLPTAAADLLQACQVRIAPHRAPAPTTDTPPAAPAHTTLPCLQSRASHRRWWRPPQLHLRSRPPPRRARATRHHQQLQRPQRPPHRRRRRHRRTTRTARPTPSRRRQHRRPQSRRMGRQTRTM